MDTIPDKKPVDNQPIASAQSGGTSVGLGQKELEPRVTKDASSEIVKPKETTLGTDALERPVEIRPQAAAPTKIQKERTSVVREVSVQALKELGAELDAQGASKRNPSFQISWLREEVQKLLKRFKIF